MPSTALPRRMLVIAICVSALLRAASVIHAHNDAPVHAHLVAFASVDSQHHLVYGFAAALHHSQNSSIATSGSHADHAIHCSAPVPHSGFAVVETVIAEASGRTALSKPTRAENPFDGVLLSLASLDGCKVIAAIPQRHSVGRDEASPLNFILRTNHAFLA